MKTTIEMPEALYKEAKIRAVEKGITLKELIVTALGHELAGRSALQEPQGGYWSRRQMTPKFKKLWEAHGLSGGTESTRSISEDRDTR